MSLYSNSIITEAYSMILEAYAGKPKEFIRCEKLLGEISSQIRKDNTEFYDLVRDRNVVMTYPQNRELCKILADFFKVDKVNIYWESGVINAETLLPNTFAIPNYKNKFMSNKPSDLKMHILINEDLVTKCNLTPQELMACILHEIGHNFYTCPIMIMSAIIMVIVTFPVGIVLDFMKKGIYKVFREFNNFIKAEIPLLTNIGDMLKHTLFEFKQYVKPVEIAAYVAISIAQFVQSPAVKLNLAAYGNEKGADSFAAKYGYGPELASALTKMSTPTNTSYSHSIEKGGDGWQKYASVMDDLCTLSIDLVSGMTMDPHPNSNQRAYSMLDKLEDDLRTGKYPPGARKDLEDEIKRMRRAYEVINDPKYGGDSTIRKGWYHMIDHITHGHSDIREIFNFYFDSFRF